MSCMAKAACEPEFILTGVVLCPFATLATFWKCPYFEFMSSLIIYLACSAERDWTAGVWRP